MGKQHAIQEAQEELAGIGVSGTVTDVQRHRREAVIAGQPDGALVRLITLFGTNQYPQLLRALPDDALASPNFL